MIVTTFSAEQQLAVDQAITEKKVLLDKAINACVALDQGEPIWRFTLSDGITAKVIFHGGPPNKAHLAAFTAIFAAVVENYIMPEPRL